jgi:hypothetical protein
MQQRPARSADILSASERSSLISCWKNRWERLFALRAQAGRMPALPR